MQSLKRDSQFLSLTQIQLLTESLRTSFQAIFSFLISCLAMSNEVHLTQKYSLSKHHLHFISRGQWHCACEWEGLGQRTFQSEASLLFRLFPFPLQHRCPEKPTLARAVTTAQLRASSWQFNLIFISEGKYTSVFYMCLVSLYLNFAWFSADEYCRKIWIYCN